MKFWKIVYLNTVLKRQGTWGIEAESQEEALKKFRQMHRDFCQMLSVSVQR